MLLAACGPSIPEPEPTPTIAEEDKPVLGLMTSLPIYWGEAASFADQIASDAPPHWVRVELEKRYRLMPLDTLAGAGDATLANVDFLLLAQPRALSGEENVALDDWVRAGGRVLLFADPLLTSHSRFPLGDPRRPLDIALLSPILDRWGLELTFDESQPEGEQSVEAADVAIPVNLRGAFEVSGDGGCTLGQNAFYATCVIGEGRVLALADAALLEELQGQHNHGDGVAESTEQRRKALNALLSRGFSHE